MMEAVGPYCDRVGIPVPTTEAGIVELVTGLGTRGGDSTAIGMLNLFPIPVLDGGHLVMHAYEAVAGRPPAERFMRIAMSIGLAMVLLLMVFATYNDVMRWAIS